MQIVDLWPHTAGDRAFWESILEISGPASLRCIGKQSQCQRNDNLLWCTRSWFTFSEKEAQLWVAGPQSFVLSTTEKVSLPGHLRILSFTGYSYRHLRPQWWDPWRRAAWHLGLTKGWVHFRASWYLWRSFTAVVLNTGCLDPPEGLAEIPTLKPQTLLIRLEPVRLG